uniref:Ribosomal protein L41 n=2 Tax=Mus TaxID=862507 RepID=H3BK91_MOUSE
MRAKWRKKRMRRFVCLPFQAEAQEKKDEAEVQVSQPVHLRRLQEQK